MNLKEKIISLAEFFDEKPGLPEAEVHSKAAKALEKAADVWLEIKSEEERNSSREYNDLFQALGAAESAKRIDLAWLKERCKPYGIKTFKRGAIKTQVLAAAAYDAGDAAALLAELKKSPEALMQEEFREMVSLEDSVIKARLTKKYKGAALEKFCAANGVPVVTKQVKGKTALNPAKTKEEILAKMHKLRERL